MGYIDHNLKHSNILIHTLDSLRAQPINALV